MFEIVALLIAIGIGLAVAFLLWNWYRLLTPLVPEMIGDRVSLRILVPVNNDKQPLAAEQFLQALHGTLQDGKQGKDVFALEIYANAKAIFFLITTPTRYAQFVENQIYGQYPEAQVERVHDFTSFEYPKTMARVSSEIGFVTKDKEGNNLPYPQIRTFANFNVDPLAAITAAMSGIPDSSHIWFQIVIRPVAASWWSKFRVEPVKKDAEGKVTSPENEKLKKQLFQTAIRITALSSAGQPEAAKLLQDMGATFNQFGGAEFGQLVFLKGVKTTFLDIIRRKVMGKTNAEKLPLVARTIHRFLDSRTDQIFTTTELASVFHLPNQNVKTPNIAWAKSKKLEYPQNLPFVDLAHIDADISPIALTDYHNQHLPFGLKRLDRRRHMYLLGKTGTGKSTLMKNLVIQDIMRGEGLAVLDPHGELVDELLDLIPEHRMQDVVYLDPSDMDFPVSLNMLDIKPDETKELLSDGIVNVFKKFFGDSWGPRLQYLLTNAVLTLLNCQNVSLLAVTRLLTDTNYRKFLLKQVDDPFLLKFWNEEYAAMAENPKLLSESLSPIQNKVGRFLNSPMVRNMVGQIKSSIDLLEIMNSGKILLVNLSQGKIGEENSSLLGGMLVTRLYTNAMQRAKMDPKDRRDFYLYVDEFQNFANESFVKILSEARKYALNLIITHQYIDQIDQSLQNAIFGNIGTLMNYVVGQKDGHRLEQEYAPHLNAEDLVNLDKYRLAMKMTIDAAQTPPFTAIAMAPQYKTQGKAEEIKQASRDQYAKPREIVEQKINKWAGQVYDDRGNLQQ